MDALAAYDSSSESDDESGGSKHPAHVAACPPPSASDAMSDGNGFESNQDGTEGGNVSDDARISTAATKFPDASAVDDNNQSDDGASSRPSDEDEDEDEDEGSDDGAKAEAVVNSVKKPVDKSKWGCLGQVPADKRKVGLDKAPVKFVKVPNRGGLALPANAKVGKAKPITVDRPPPPLLPPRPPPPPQREHQPLPTAVSSKPAEDGDEDEDEGALAVVNEVSSSVSRAGRV